MKTLTSKDKGKRYFIDSNREDEVELVDSLPDNDGWVKIKYPKGQVINVEQKRLTEIAEIPPFEYNPDEIDLEYPEKVSKLSIEIFDAESGEVFTKWLEGAEAEKWNTWMRELCYKAEAVGMNPKWLSLKWQGKKSKRNK